PSRGESRVISAPSRSAVRPRGSRRTRSTGGRTQSSLAPAPQAPAPGARADPALAQALRRLSPAQRAAIVSRFYLDLSVDDSAQILGKRPGTVRALTAQGVARLREELGPDCWRRTMNRSFRERLSALADFGSSYTPDRADLERRIARRRRTRRLG